ncbi:MAG: IS200/IS605 family element RNA-guided endonuclease TnpB [Anaerovoracaceae bacterium]
MIKCHKAYKFRIYPNEKQQIMFAKTFGCVRFVYNRMLEEKINHYNNTKEKLNVTPAKYKKEYEWLKEVDSLALANAQLNLQTAYNNFFRDKKIGFPKFKSKHKNKQSYTTNCVNGNIKLENGYIKLPKLGLVRLKQHRQIPENYKLKSATISQSPSKKYYVSILFEYENQVQEIIPKTFLGLDFSMHDLFVTSDGEICNYPRYYRQSEKKLAKEQRKLSLMVKGSKNRNKQRIKVAKLHEHISNQRKDYLHKKSRELTNKHDCVCIEDLNMQGISQCLNFGKSVSDNGWGIFTIFLAYKLAERGKKLIKVDKFFPSSQTCNVCGSKNPITKDLSVREWTCRDCNTHHDRDINAAINIRNKGMQLA